MPYANPDQEDPLGQNWLTDLSQLFGKTAAGRGQGRLDETNALANRDRAASDLYRTQVDTALKAPSVYTSQAVRGNLLNGLQDASVTGLPSYVHMPQMSGGLRPSALGPESRQAGAALTRNALMNLMQNQFQLPKAPQLSPLPHANALDSILSKGSLASGVAGALGKGGGSGGGGDLGQLFGDIKGLFGKGGGDSYDPWSDPANYDENGQFIGQGAWDEQGNYIGNGEDPYAGAGGGDPAGNDDWWNF